MVRAIRNPKSAIRNLLSLAVLSWLASTGAAQSERPNILFIMSDDHAYQAISAYDGSRNQTPNIDRIAKEGMRFDRCYVTNSLCGPSRAVILTGKYSHKNGFYDNTSHKPFDGSQVTFPKLLKQAGYQTAIVGKWHLESEPTGFDFWEILQGQGQYYRPDLITAEGKRAVPGYVTEIITNEALNWLKTKRDPNRPFALMVQHKAPHRPWSPAPQKLGDREGEKIAEPPTLFDDYATRGTAAHKADMRISQMNPPTDLKLWEAASPARKQLFNRMSDSDKAAWEKLVDPRRAKFDEADPKGEDRTRWFYQLYMKDYLRCIESVDDSVGQLLKYLDDSGLAKNTIVVYTSDQGFYMGEHGWFDKRFMYEESLRTPLVIRWPGTIKPGSVDSDIVSNVDFGPTFLEAAGTAVPTEMQGHSIVPILRGKPAEDWRKSFYYHFYEDKDADHHVAKHEGVTTGHAKLIHFYTLKEWELYDLDKDPHELNNVYGKPEYAKLQGELTTELGRLRHELDVPANAN
ncbi:MAG TPA: sulfatase [Lacipirellulaceae bacterium]|nr:sulfatase [Lacipirellulaceae bacterium]